MNDDAKQLRFRAFLLSFQRTVFARINELHKEVGSLADVPFWKAASIGFYIGQGMSVEEAVELASVTFDHKPDSYELAKAAKWTGVMPNNAADEFVLFNSGELVRKISKEEALLLCPEVRTFPI